MYIHPELRDALARRTRRDMIAASERSRRLARGARRPGLPAGHEITIRPATPADARALTRLAILDAARPLDGDALVAEVEGALWAACSLTDGRTIGDPF